jgi:hypothetical protein
VWNTIKGEPALFLGLVQAALALGLSFGLKLSAAQVGGIVACTAALLSLWTRHLVTPTSDPRQNDGTKLVPEVPPSRLRPAA